MDSLQEVTNALSNGTVPNPYGLPSPRLGVRNPNPNCNRSISGTAKAIRTAKKKFACKSTFCCLLGSFLEIGKKIFS